MSPTEGHGVDMGGISRHLHQSAPQAEAWKCTRCGEENVSVFVEGCPACGAGAPGKHVGVDPITPKVVELPTPEGTPSVLAFVEWLRRRPATDELFPPLQQVRDAFLAGYAAGQKYLMQGVPPPSPIGMAGTSPIRRVTISSPNIAKTVVAALHLYITEGLLDPSVSVAQIDELITQLEGLNDD